VMVLFAKGGVMGAVDAARAWLAARVGRQPEGGAR
jgi:hypothetical protein